MGIGTIGISSTIDVGNFSMDDIVVGIIDQILPIYQQTAVAPTSSLIDVMSDFFAFLIAHEAGHSFGMYHTSGLNAPAPFPPNLFPNIMDEGATADFLTEPIGTGPDGIFGTIDDVDVNFVSDVFSYLEGRVGINQTGRSLSQTLATGKLGGGITGRVFNDFNRDGDGNGDLPIEGVTIFADIDNDGVRGPTEPFGVSSASGNYFLTATPGNYNLIATTPPGFNPTTPTVVPVSISATQGAVVDFGFGAVEGGFTGTTFSDDNANGIRDANEGGVEGIFLYADLDNDNRPDLGEPRDVSAADGSYFLNFPGAGNYTIRQVLPPGFELTTPSSGEHNLFFNGATLTQNFDFGLLPSRDFG